MQSLLGAHTVLFVLARVLGQPEAGVEGPPSGEIVEPERRPEPPRNMWKERRVAVEVHLGVATPVGFVGAALDYSAEPWLSVGCGIGTAFVSVEGACMVRARWVRATGIHGYYVGVGVSGGPYRAREGFQYGLLSVPYAPLTAMGHRSYRERYWSFAKWLNLELGFERRSQQGFVARPYLGLAILLNPGDSELQGSEEFDADVKVPTALLYGGLALGAAFSDVADQ